MMMILPCPKCKGFEKEVVKILEVGLPGNPNDKALWRCLMPSCKHEWEGHVGNPERIRRMEERGVMF